MLPVMSAASDISDVSKMPQQIFIGTPPSPTCKGTVFAELHDTAHSDDKGNTWWLEWSIQTGDLFQTIKDADTALELAYMTNPAMGYRISEKTILNEYETMGIDGFARERLGWWSPSVVKKVDKAIDQDTWDACKSSELKPEGKTAYGVKFSSDGSVVCLCGAVINAEGIARISLIEQKHTVYGLQWLADWLNARYDKASCVVIDGRNGVDVLIDKISNTWRYKGSVVKPGAKDVIAAVGTLTDAIAEKQITWYEKQDALRDSAITSVKRPIGGGWGFGGDNSAPIEACALALWGVKNSKRNPKRKMRLG